MGDQDEGWLESQAEHAVHEHGARSPIHGRARSGRTTDGWRQGAPRPGRRRPVATEDRRRAAPGQGDRSTEARPTDRDQTRERTSDRGGNQRGSLESLPVGAAVLVLVVYFAWVCVQMASHTPSGKGLLVGIFGGAAAGVLALLVGIWLGR